MQKQLLQICKPHFIDRFQQPAPIIIKTKREKSNKHQQKVKKHIQTERSKQIQQKKEYQLKQVRKFKEELLQMLMNSKQHWQKLLLKKRKAVILMKEEHQINLQQIFDEIAKIKIKIYQMFKHECKNRKQGHCRLCFQTQNQFKQGVLNYLKNSKKGDEIRQSRRNGILKIKIKKIRDKLVNQTGGQNDSKLSNALLKQKQNEATIKNDALNDERFNLTYQDGANGKGASLFRFNKSSQGSFINKIKGFGKNQGKQSNDISGSSSKKKRLKKSNRKDSSNYTEVNSQEEIQSLLIKSLSDSELNQHCLNPNQLGTNTHARRSYRKSIIKLSGSQIDELTNTNKGKSKFYCKDQDEKCQKIDQIDYLNDSLHQSTLRGGKSQKKKTLLEQCQQQEQQLLFKKKKTATSKKGRLETHNTEHLLLDIQSVQTRKEIKLETKPQSIIKIEENVQVKSPVQVKGPKFSRYQRQRMFYGYLKQELVKVGCLQAFRGNYETYLNRESQMSIESVENIENESKQEYNYSLKQRKQSLIQKLNIFNQTSNFQDIKNKIGATLDQKNNYINQNLKKQCQLIGKSGVNQQAKQKIIQKFLSEVLKISDLKRLLRKKFSKEMTWSPKMRQMHQFYTYLQYSLQIFRNHLAKNHKNNCIQLSIEGKQAQINLQNFTIEQNIGHYEGLEGQQNAEYQHHKQIECSMKYYGIEVKRLEKLKEFHYQDFQQKPLQPSVVSQKSLKQIQECVCSIPKYEIQ